MARKYMAKSFNLKEAVRHRLRLPPESIGVINGLVGPIGNKHGLVGPRHAIVIGNKRLIRTGFAFYLSSK